MTKSELNEDSSAKMTGENETRTILKKIYCKRYLIARISGNQLVPFDKLYEPVDWAKLVKDFEDACGHTEEPCIVKMCLNSAGYGFIRLVGRTEYESLAKGGEVE